MQINWQHNPQSNPIDSYRIYYSESPFTADNLPDTYVDQPPSSTSVNVPINSGYVRVAAILEGVKRTSRLINSVDVITNITYDPITDIELPSDEYLANSAAVSISPTGRYLGSASNNSVRIFDKETGEVIDFENENRQIYFTNCGGYVLIGSDLKKYRMSDFGYEKRLAPTYTAENDIKETKDGKHLIVDGDNSGFFIYNMADWNLLVLNFKDSTGTNINSLDLSPDKKSIVFLAASGEVWKYNIETGKYSYTGFSVSVTPDSFSELSWVPEKNEILIKARSHFHRISADDFKLIKHNSISSSGNIKLSPCGTYIAFTVATGSTRPIVNFVDYSSLQQLPLGSSSTLSAFRQFDISQNGKYIFTVRSSTVASAYLIGMVNL